MQRGSYCHGEIWRCCCWPRQLGLLGSYRVRDRGCGRRRCDARSVHLPDYRGHARAHDQDDQHARVHDQHARVHGQYVQRVHVHDQQACSHDCNRGYCAHDDDRDDWSKDSLQENNDKFLMESPQKNNNYRFNSAPNNNNTQSNNNNNNHSSQYIDYNKDDFSDISEDISTIYQNNNNSKLSVNNVNNNSNNNNMNGMNGSIITNNTFKKKKKNIYKKLEPISIKPYIPIPVTNSPLKS